MGYFNLNILSNYLFSLSLYFIVLCDHLWYTLLTKFDFLPKYYSSNENMWGDGFLFDFLQKKTMDSWLRQYVMYTGFLFSESVVFEGVVRLYNDLIIWPGHNFSIFEPSNTSGMLSTTIFTYFTLFVMVMMTLTLFL